MTDRPHSSIAVRLLRKLSDAIWLHPKAFVWPQVLLFAVCVLGTAKYLKAEMDRNALVGGEKRYHHNFLRFKAEFPTQDDLVAVIESDDHEKNRQFIERLGAKLEANSTLVSPTNLLIDVFYKGDLKLMGKRALLFVPDDALSELSKALGEYRPLLEQFSQASNLVTLFGKVNHQIRTAKREQNSENDSLTHGLPALERILVRARECLQRSGTPPSPGLDALFGAGPEAEQEKYITFSRGRIYIATAKARDESLNIPAVDLFRELVRQTQQEVPGINVGITGEPVLEYDEMRQSQHDSTVATILSLAIVALIFILGYRQTGRPLKATLCLIIGLGYTMGFTTLVVGHLNILTITFVPMLIGLAIDFGVHLITRYEEELLNGRSMREAMDKAVVNTGQGIFTGCFTTAGAFFAMTLTDFKGIQEMGIITGGGMLICLFPMMTLLPVLLLQRGKQNQHDLGVGQESLSDPAKAAALSLPTMDRRQRIERLWLDRPWMVMGFVGVLCVLAAVRIPRVTFDYNLLNLQSHGLSAVIFEEKLIESSTKSVLYGAVVANTPAQAAVLESKLAALPSVSGTDSMSRYLQASATNKLPTITRIRQQAESIHFAPTDGRPVDVSEFSQTLWSLGGYLGLVAEEVAKTDDQQLLRQVVSLRETAQSLRVAMNRGNAEISKQRLTQFQAALFSDIQETFENLRTQEISGSMKESDLPVALRNRFVGITGKHLIQVYPKKNVWNREAQEEFVRELRTVDPEVTGTPVQLLEYTGLLKTSYVEAAGWALLAIAILVFIHFRSLKQLILALLPVAIGALWMVGFMGWTGIPFNPANIMTLPLVIGIGVTNGIHILNRFAEERNPSILAKSTGKAVLVSGLTTIAGFGSLVIADHRGIQSLGSVMAVGTATCMIAGLTFLPALLKLMQRDESTYRGSSTLSG